ncbi:MAG: DUF697 domain-containing protein [Lentisphaeria bacterium]|jgi:uncharacterized protein (DUF697 family)/ethanolamine utilization protein EutP (predicted NTPase)
MIPTIMVCGKTGVGKTSLVQAVTHAGTVPDEAISHSEPATEDFVVYETEAAQFVDCEGMEPGQTVDEYSSFIMDEIIRRLDGDDASKVVHCIWYCISGAVARVQSSDARLIRQFSDRVLLVVTKSDCMRKGQVEEMMNVLLDLIPAERVVLVSSLEKSGLAQLLDKSMELCADAEDYAEGELASFRARWDSYYARMRRNWQDRTNEQADSLINWAAGRAAAIAIMPLPLADVAPLMANELYMIYKLGAVYGYAVDKTVLTMLAGVAGGSIVGKTAASFLPFLKVPIAAAVTYGVGKAAKAYFESGMTLDVKELKQRFLAAEREAKQTNWNEKKVEEDEP